MFGINVDEKMFLFPQYRNGAGKCADGVFKVCRLIMSTADFAVVAVLFRLAAFRTGSFDKAVGKESFCFDVIKLFDFFFFDDIGFSHCRPDFMAESTIFGTVCGAVVGEVNVETGEVIQVSGVHRLNEVFFFDVFLSCAEHNGCSVGVIGTDIDALITT